ncbi:hypothetical protein [Rhizobium halophytocola]|uniref:Uncharacterized protein n=1 Tax=Rhizobium halophytocola TaxID=735519 RepID=A0ABS4E0C9_9HYPH|nr:hypothetical protein [Rhizobium halophytocola]MBP1851359.1 hypothetical protein [Rhizobium halophytocola]
MYRQALLAASLFALLPASVGAEDLENGRYTFQPMENGLVRLDTRTGAMSLCQDKDGALICRMAADERAAYEEQLDRLEKRVTALETRIDSGGTALSSRNGTLPDDAEIDRSLGIMERFMRSFFGIVREFESKDKDATPTAQSY